MDQKTFRELSELLSKLATDEPITLGSLEQPYENLAEFLGPAIPYNGQEFFTAERERPIRYDRPAKPRRRTR